MTVGQDLATSYQLDGHLYQAHTHIKQTTENGVTRYQAVIKDSPIHGTYGGWADTVEEALDFLDLAMQAEGADEIQFDK